MISWIGSSFYYCKNSNLGEISHDHYRNIGRNKLCMVNDSIFKVPHSPDKNDNCFPLEKSERNVSCQTYTINNS